MNRPLFVPSDLERHASHLATLQMSADGFGLGAIEACKACAVERLVAFGGAFSVGAGGVEQIGGLAARDVQSLLGLVLKLESADLDGPTAGLRRGGSLRPHGGFDRDRWFALHSHAVDAGGVFRLLGRF